MKEKLFNEIEASLVINSMSALKDRLESKLPQGVSFGKYERKYELNHHKQNLRMNWQFSDTSLHINGRIDGKSYRCLTGEVRFFLKECHYKGRFKAMLFLRVGLGYGFKSTNLFESNDEGIASPFIYGDSVEEVIQTIQIRMEAAIQRGLGTDCSKWADVYNEDKKARSKVKV